MGNDANRDCHPTFVKLDGLKPSSLDELGLWNVVVASSDGDRSM